MLDKHSPPLGTTPPSAVLIWRMAVRARRLRFLPANVIESGCPARHFYDASSSAATFWPRPPVLPRSRSADPRGRNGGSPRAAFRAGHPDRKPTLSRQFPRSGSVERAGARLPAFRRRDVAAGEHVDRKVLPALSGPLPDRRAASTHPGRISSTRNATRKAESGCR